MVGSIAWQTLSKEQSLLCQHWFLSITVSVSNLIVSVLSMEDGILRGKIMRNSSSDLCCSTKQTPNRWEDQVHYIEQEKKGCHRDRAIWIRRIDFSTFFVFFLVFFQSARAARFTVSEQILKINIYQKNFSFESFLRCCCNILVKIIDWSCVGGCRWVFCSSQLQRAFAEKIF